MFKKMFKCFLLRVNSGNMVFSKCFFVGLFVFTIDSTFQLGSRVCIQHCLSLPKPLENLSLTDFSSFKNSFEHLWYLAILCSSEMILLSSCQIVTLK